MPHLTEEIVRDALRTVKYPGFTRNIVSFGLVRDIQIKGPDVSVRLALATRDASVPDSIRRDVESALTRVPGVGSVSVHIELLEAPAAPGGQAENHASAIPGVKHIVAVASGKGGVGKSTVAANIALASARLGWKTGLCDCDLYGPSMGLMFGVNERPYATGDNRIQPIERHGLRLMSMAFLLEDDAPVVLRGPMVTRYTQQFLRQVDWGDLDLLVLDLPPGTGDIQLTIVQTVALSGALLVSTPQEVALIDARKAASMFAKVQVPVLGIVENMSFFQCPTDGVRYPIFGEGGGRREAARLGVPLLGEVPIDMPTRESGDLGLPVVARKPESPAAKVFREVAQILHSKLL